MLTPLEVSQIYIAIFGRAPEGEGLKFWLNTAYQNNWNLAQLADAMIQAAKAYPGYENIDDPQTLVEALYKNILGKTYQDDPDGINFWVSKIQGGFDKGYVVKEILRAAIEQYPDNPATLTLMKRASLGLEIAKRIPKFEGDFSLFKEIIQEVKEDSDIYEVLKKHHLDIQPVMDFDNLQPPVEDIPDQNTNESSYPVYNSLDDLLINLDGEDLINTPDGKYDIIQLNDGSITVVPDGENNITGSDIGDVIIQHLPGGVNISTNLTSAVNVGGEGELSLEGHFQIPYTNPNSLIVNDLNLTEKLENGFISLEHLKGVIEENGNVIGIDLKGYVKENIEGTLVEGNLIAKAWIGKIYDPSTGELNYQLSPDSQIVLQTAEGYGIDLTPYLMDYLSLL